MVVWERHSKWTEAHLIMHDPRQNAYCVLGTWLLVSLSICHVLYWLLYLYNVI